MKGRLFHIGMDVHKDTISIAVMNSAGKLVMECVIETKASTILQFVHGLRGDLHVTFEEGTWAAWLYDLRQGAQPGIFEPGEYQIVERVFQFADRRVSAIMTPRGDIVWMDVKDSYSELRTKVTASLKSRFPVCDDDLDRVIGILHAKDSLAAPENADIRSRKAPGRRSANHARAQSTGNFAKRRSISRSPSTSTEASVAW